MKTRISNVWLAMSVFLLVMASTGTGEIIFVDAGATGSNNGSSWENGFKSLKNGLAAASSGDKIRVAEGVYKPGSSRMATFHLINGVTINGGYAGFGEPNPDARDVDAYETILSGNIGSAGRSDNSYHVVTGTGCNVTAVLNGFTITGGNANSSTPNTSSYYGGGMSNGGSSPKVINCTFIGNSASWGGGGMANWGSPTVINCIFIGNSASDGGAVWNGSINSEPVLRNCIFSDNTAADQGGGMYNWNGCVPVLTNCVFIDNSANRGGGMWNIMSDLRLINCTFSGNSASRGGGIENLSSAPTLTNCLLWGNIDNGGMDESAQMDTTSIPGRQPVVKYSCIQGWTGALGGVGNIGDDPHFAFPNDYHLMPDSPCIDAGTNSPIGGLPATDIDGQPRVVGARVDMGADEFPYESATLVGFEITGPEEIPENSTAQYSAIAFYEPNYTADVTSLAIWSLKPQECGSINENGVLTTERIEMYETITIYARYTEAGVTTEAEMTVQVSPLVDLQITGPQAVRENHQEQYRLIAYYGNGHTSDVTDSALWRVEPQAIANIEAGLLCTEDIDELQNITIYAQYTSGGVTLEGEMTVQVSPPRTLYVPAEYETIQAAIDVAWWDTVIVADGTYTGPGNRDIDFLGKAITVRSETGPENCIIDCQALGRGFYFHSGEDANSVLDGFTITNGYASGSRPENRGGAIYCEGTSPTVANCRIISNTATSYGSGICSYGGNPKITNCNIIANRGTGIYCRYGNPTISNSNIIDNLGHGVYCDSDTTPEIINCTISGNKAGGIYCYYSSPTIIQCIITENSAEAGAGIHTFRSNPTIINSNITGNLSQYRGGGIYCEDSSPTITNCTISNNSAQKGGGIFYGTSVITNCIISGNSADLGGGIYCYNGSGVSSTSSTITNCTFAANSSPKGSALACDSGTSKPMYAHLANCILHNGGNETWKDNISTITVAYSNVQGGFEGEGNINADPCFAFPRDYHLMPTSPCIDAGTNTPIGGLPTTDIDGNPRPLDGNGDGSAIADMGAYEYNIEPRIAFSRLVFDLARLPGGPNPDDQILSLRNAGGGTMAWQIIEDCAWLEIIPTSGTSAGQINDVVLRTDATDLPRGYYICELQIVSEQAVNSPKIVTVNLRAMDFLEVPAMYPTIQAAIVSAFEGETIFVAPGVYTGPGNRDIDFLGKAITVRSIDPNDPNIVATTIIDCNGTETEAHRGFYFHSGEDVNCVLSGFTITNGYTDWGGGICCVGSSPTITDCIISDNVSRGRFGCGGGMYSEYSNPTLTNCTFSGNSADRCGGGLHNVYYSDPTLTNCTFSGNSARSGGGMENHESNPMLTNCTISGNSAGDGGGMSNGYSSPTLTNCTFSGNTAERDGGGMSNWYKCSPTLTNCTFAANSALNGNALAFVPWNRPSNFQLTNCIIIGNSVADEGAIGSGICCENSTSMLTNCTFSGNSASNGNALACDSWRQLYPSNVQMTNCILWDGGDEIWNNDGSTITITYTDVQGGWPGEGNIDYAPCFVEPGYWDVNGVWVDGDYHLLRTSPCIDAANDANVYTDIEGNSRPFDFPGVDNNGELPEFDMGAYEAMVSCFGVNHLKIATKGNNVELKGTFAPALPIDFAVDDVAYIIDDAQGHTFAFLIPAGSFEVDGKPDKQKFKFHSAKGSQPDIKAKFDFDKCKFELNAKEVMDTDEITSTTLTIELWAGANVAQEVVEVKVKPRHLEYKREPKLNCCPKCKGIALLEVTSTDPFTGDEYVLLFEPEPGKEKLKRKTVVDDGVNGRVKIDTSCSKPLEVGDVFGVYTVTDLIKIFDDDE